MRWPSVLLLACLPFGGTACRELAHTLSWDEQVPQSVEGLKEQNKTMLTPSRAWFAEGARQETP